MTLRAVLALIKWRFIAPVSDAFERLTAFASAVRSDFRELAVR